jgi:hypothetical protein
MWGFVRSTMMWFERVIANAADKGKRDKRMTGHLAQPCAVAAVGAGVSRR